MCASGCFLLEITKGETNLGRTDQADRRQALTHVQTPTVQHWPRAALSQPQRSWDPLPQAETSSALSLLLLRLMTGDPQLFGFVLPL